MKIDELRTKIDDARLTLNSLPDDGGLIVLCGGPCASSCSSDCSGACSNKCFWGCVSGCTLVSSAK